MLDLLTQKPVLPVAVASSQKSAGEDARKIPNSVDETGQSFSQSLEQEQAAKQNPSAAQSSKTDDAAAGQDAPAGTQGLTNAAAGPATAQAATENTAASQDIDKLALLGSAQPQVTQDRADKTLAPGVTAETTGQQTPQAADPASQTSAAADLAKPQAPVQIAISFDSTTSDSASLAESSDAASALGLGDTASAALDDTSADTGAASAPKDILIADGATSETPNADDAATVTPGAQTPEAAMADPAATGNGAPETRTPDGQDTNAAAATSAALPAAAANTAQNAAKPARANTQPLNAPATAGAAAPPSDGAIEAQAAGQQAASDVAAETTDLADAQLDKPRATGAGDANTAAAKPATFEQALNAQSQPQTNDPAASLGLVKAPASEQLSTKPLPEVAVQVPQQRADMAAKQVGLELAKQAKNGDTHFIVRMDPPELGKLDVRLTINKAGEIQANILVDRESTLDLLNRDARSLERSLTDAGLKMDQNALNLGLKNQDPKGGDLGQTASGPQAGGESLATEDGEELPQSIDPSALAQMQISSGRPLDVVI